MIANAVARGTLGEKTYNVGGWNENKNLEVEHTLYDLLDKAKPKSGGSYREPITCVKDPPDHDRRYCDRCAQA